MRYEYGSANGTYSTEEILNFFVSVTSTQLTDHGVASWSSDPDETIELVWESGAKQTVSYDRTNTDGVIELHDFISYAPNGELIDKYSGFGLKEINLNELLENASETAFAEDFAKELFSGNDWFVAELPTTFSGYGGDDTFYNTSGNDRVYGGSGNDLIYAGQGVDVINGGDGIDTFRYRTMSFEDLDLDKIEGGYQVSIDNFLGDNWFYDVDILYGIERIKMFDGTLALDIDSGDTAGQAYRLYQAAFARTPDMPGVAYHMNDMESNGLSIQQIASNFMASPEFKSMYGENPTDDEYINALYQNVLGRGAGVEEVAYYQERFDNGTWDRPQVMINFAESPENVSLVGPDIANGIWLPDV